jgi:hypothetical protein
MMKSIIEQLVAEADRIQSVLLRLEVHGRDDTPYYQEMLDRSDLVESLLMDVEELQNGGPSAVPEVPGWWLN